LNKFISFIIIFMLLLTLGACDSKMVSNTQATTEAATEEVATVPTVVTTEATTEATTEVTTEATKAPIEATIEPTQKPVTEPTYKPTEPTYGTENEDGLVYMGNYKLTAYCPCTSCCGQWAGQTSTGVTPTAGRTIAVDPSIIPYGSKVIINGHTYIAEDCGGAIKGNRIDVFFNTHGEALQFGVQYADVYIQK
jgi:3D (Asp-Asp-Asp) domain-containing protein